MKSKLSSSFSLLLTVNYCEPINLIQNIVEIVVSL